METQLENCCSKASATATLSDIIFTIKRDHLLKKKYRTLFVCTVCQGGDVRLTNPAEVKTNVVGFYENFKFDNLPTTFSIDVKIFSIKYRRGSKSLGKINIFRKVLSKRQDLDSNFKLCGRFVITEDHHDKSPVQMRNEDSSPLEGKVDYKLSFSDISTGHKLAAFLQVGKVYESNSIIWNVYWCVLQGTSLKIYNSPVDEDFNRLSFEINLPFISIVRSAMESECARKKTLKLSVVQSDEDEMNENVYYLNFANVNDYTVWSRILSCVVKSLSNWKLSRFLQNHTSKKETLIN